MERELYATSLEDVRQFCDSHSLRSVPALPKLANLPTLVDRRLLDKESLLLESGDDALLLHLERKDFERVLKGAIICDIAVPLAPLEQDVDPSTDSEQILGAVQNFTQLRIRQRLEETLELPLLSETASELSTCVWTPKPISVIWRKWLRPTQVCRPKWSAGPPLRTIPRRGKFVPFRMRSYGCWDSIWFSTWPWA